VRTSQLNNDGAWPSFPDIPKRNRQSGRRRRSSALWSPTSKLSHGRVREADRAWRHRETGRCALRSGPQAVIAIENTRRLNELHESLQSRRLPPTY
jgi:hypothetical protein